LLLASWAKILGARGFSQHVSALKPFNECVRRKLLGLPVGLAEFDNALLGPEALASGVFRNEAAMAAVLGRDKLDGGILVDFGG